MSYSLTELWSTEKLYKVSLKEISHCSALGKSFDSLPKPKSCQFVLLHFPLILLISVLFTYK